jgi:beta-glucosidase
MLKAPATISKGKNVLVSVRVTNTGSIDGEEVVQLYLSHQNKNLIAPIKALKGFQRIALKSGESKTVQFNLTAEQLSLVSGQGELSEPTGKITISVGGGQPDIINKTSGNIVKSVISVL